MNDEVESYESELILRIPTIDNNLARGSKISDSCWNSRGNMLAVSYFIDDHQGPCNHQSIVYVFKFENILKTKMYKEKIAIDTNVIILFCFIYVLFIYFIYVLFICFNYMFLMFRPV